LYVNNDRKNTMASVFKAIERLKEIAWFIENPSETYAPSKWKIDPTLPKQSKKEKNNQALSP